MPSRRCLLRTLALIATVGVAACSMPRMIDSTVSTYPGFSPAVRDVGFAFARLPSQQAYASQQDLLEAMARTALAEAGLHFEAMGTPRYRAEVALQIDPIKNPYARHQRFTELPGPGPFGHAPVFIPEMEPSWWRHSVHLVLREHGTGEVAYDTRATFDGPWRDSERLVPVLLQAALRDYPHPPQPERTVVIELPGRTAGD